MGIVASAQMAQDHYLSKQSNEVTKKNFHVDKKALTMNVVATLRDDLRDLCDQQYASLETMMLLSTLVLEFGLGFVVEGTFPHPDIYNSMDWEWYTPLLMVYSALMGLSIMFPFWSIWASIECTRQLNQFMKKILETDPATRVDLESMIQSYKDFEIFWQKNCHWLYTFTMKCFWLGMLTNITSVSILITMNFYHDYEEPWAWRSFSGIMGINLVLVFVLYVKNECQCFRAGPTFSRGFTFRSKLQGNNSYKEPLLDQINGEYEMTTSPHLIDQQSSSLHGRAIPTGDGPSTDSSNFTFRRYSESSVMDEHQIDHDFFDTVETAEDITVDPSRLMR